MIWAKTDAGRAEIKSRALIKDRARRNLLLLVDGSTSEETLLANIAGIGADDFKALSEQALIAPVASSVRTGDPSLAAARRPAVVSPPAQSELSYDQLNDALTVLIYEHLGLRGMSMSMAVDRAKTVDDLHEVAKRVLDQIRERKGTTVANLARKSIYGG